MEAGFSRMNDLTVLQASQGLAIYIENNVQDAKKRGIVIGHDHRHHSLDFARLTAFAFIQRGFKVWYYKELVHTPLVVRENIAILYLFIEHQYLSKIALYYQEITRSWWCYDYSFPRMLY